MEENKRAAGDILLELREAEELECSQESAMSLTVTESGGSFISLICC